MIRNYFKIAWRNLNKNRVFSLINISGLTIGITVCLMIFLFVLNEFSYDNFHSNGNRIYRVMRTFGESNDPAPWVSGPYATALRNDFPEDIKDAVRIMPSSDLISFGDVSFTEKKVYIADSGFFQLFTFPLVRGNSATVLSNPNSIVLTESTAKKYFGSIENAIGKTLELNKRRLLQVTGIAKDPPSNSHLNFDLVIPLSHFYNEPWFNVWLQNNNFTYVLLDEKTERSKLGKLFPPFMEKYMGKDMAQLGAKFNLSLIPMKEVYLGHGSSFDPVKHGNKKVVYVFLSIAILILLIACINFMNLSTIRAVERSREVGLRKVLGAMRKQLILQFIGESILLTSISCILAFGILQLALPLYNRFLGDPLNVSWNEPSLFYFLIATTMVVGILAGSYPAFFLSAFKPIESLKGKLRLGQGGFFFRQTLVVVQFSISVMLIIGTIIIMNQMEYMRNKELGYDQEHTVVLRIDNSPFYDNMHAFKTELQNNSHIASVSMMSGEPGGFFDLHTFEAEGQGDIWKARTEFADFELVKTLKLNLIAGRDFSSGFPTDTTDAVLINRSAATELGFTPEQAIGKWIKNTYRDSTRRRVIGVVEDFNFLSLKEKMDALVIAPNEDRRVALVKIKSGNIQEALAIIKDAYKKVAADYPFEYSFLDQNFDDLYKTDLKQQQLLSLFSGLAIFIACLGLFGLASFTAAKRFKEIGIRKVLGSSIQNVVWLLSKDLVKPVIIATFIAIPIGWLAMNKWLESFAYKTPLSWWIFALAGLITFGIALITISFKAVKAAMRNPSESLRNE
jgi:putative ABC transport system permease protein